MQRLIKDRDFSQEITITFMRSGGPGGQHVNKVSTQAMLSFSIPNSLQLTEEEKKMLLARLSNRLKQDGTLLLRCQEHRSQIANRRAVIKKLLDLLHISTLRKKKRIPTKMSKAAKENRRQAKKRKSETKANRSKLNPRQFL